MDEPHEAIERFLYDLCHQKVPLPLVEAFMSECWDGNFTLQSLGDAAGIYTGVFVHPDDVRASRGLLTPPKRMWIDGHLVDTYNIDHKTLLLRKDSNGL